MKRIALTVLAFVAISASGCSGTSSSTPAVPSQVPTTIEYAQGDAIITGSVPAISGNLAKSTGAFVPTKVFAYNSSYDAVQGTFSGNRFFINVPVETVYGIVFTDDVNYAVYHNTLWDLHSVPLTFVSGAQGAGTASFLDGAVSESGANVVDLGEVALVDYVALNSSAKEAGIAGIAAESDADIYSSVNYPSEGDLRESSKFDIGFMSLGTASGASARLFITYDFYTTTTTDEAMGSYTSGNTFGYWGYSYLSSFVTDDLMAYLVAPVDMTNADGDVFPAGERIPTCYPDTGSGEEIVFGFFCTGVDSSVATNPAQPATGNYSVINGETQYDFVVDSTSRVLPGELVGVPLVIPMLVVEDGYVTAVDYKWIRKEADGSFVDLTKGQVASVVDPVFALQIGLPVTDFHIGSDWELSTEKSLPAAGRYALENPLLATGITQMHTSFFDISGYSYGFEWSAPQ